MNGRVAPGACVVDAPVEVRFSDEQLDKWDTHDRVKWLSAALAAAADDRSLSEQRALTAIKVLDRAFLTQEPTVRIVLYAVALEVLFSNSEDTTSGSGKTSTLEIARRVAFLTCGQGCATTGPACPYVRGFKSQKDLGTTADQIAAKGYEWRCSAFLDVARPSDMEPLFMRPSLFGARNQACTKAERPSTARTCGGSGCAPSVPCEHSWSGSQPSRSARSLILTPKSLPG